MPAEPRVSVCVPAYNHGAFLAAALDSVLSQQTNFAFEVFVGEDASTDNTREVLQRYAATDPRIRPLYRSGENKIYLDGKPTGRRNFVDLVEHQARGEYIAMLDGDDYWTDPGKLQLQIDLLDDKPDIAVSAHRIRTGPTETDSEVFPVAKRFPGGRYNTTDLFGGNFIAMAAVVFRRDPDFRIPEWVYRMPYADWPLHLLNSLRGDIWLHDEIMAFRREHSGGRWTGMQEADKLIGDLLFLHTCHGEFQPRFRPTIRRSIRDFELRALRTAIDAGGRPAAREFMKRYAHAAGHEPGRGLYTLAIIKSAWKRRRNRAGR